MENFLRSHNGRNVPRKRVAVALFAGVALIAAIIAFALLRGRQPVAPRATEIARLQAHTPPGMVLVPGGDALLGSNDEEADDEVKPQRRTFIPSFYMDTEEVCNTDYEKFDPAHKFLPGRERLPATGITYDQAAAYAKWAGKRLPTNDEWEKAARGTDGRRYPWGNDWDATKVAPRARTKGQKSDPAPASAKDVGRICYIGPPRVQPVGSRAQGASPYGCLDMAGNAWEWVQGFNGDNQEQRILRGGAVGYGERACRTYARAIEGAAAT